MNRNRDRLRVLGNFLTIFGYAIILHVSPLLGSAIKMLGFCLVLPSVIQLRMYDVVAIAGIFLALDLSNVIKILLS